MSLSELFARSLSAASKASNLPTVEDKTQGLIRSCLKDLITIKSRLAALSIFSPNELLDDIGTKDLVYIFVPYVHSEALDRVKTVEITERLQVLNQAQRLLRDFVSSIENFEIVPESERALYQRKASAVRDHRQKRELKILQFKTEKDLRAKLEAIRDRRGWRSVTPDDGNDLDLISMLLPSDAGSRLSEDEEELDAEIEDALREGILILLRLLYTKAHNRMDNMEQELDLLRNVPAPDRRQEEDVPQEQRRTADENLWRVDAPQPVDRGFDGKGPLLDSSGKPLQPFMILPSEAANRARIQTQVFGPSHRLPTMTIDEYLEIERGRGNILSGGGRASQEAPTSTEKLTLSAEMDGTRESEEKVEELRQKQEKWAQFTEANSRGAGNTMNRG